MINQKPKGTGKGYTNGLQYYRGVLGTRPFSKLGQYYFEVSINFFVKRSLRQDLIFEIALCRRGDVDNNYSVDCNKFAWAMCARRCPLCRAICLQAWNNGQRLFHTPVTENDPPGTSLKTTIGFLLNTRMKTWFAVDVKNRKGIYKFKNLDVSRPLWPVFGVYNPDLTNVTLTLRSGKEITAVPDVLMDGSYSARN